MPLFTFDWSSLSNGASWPSAQWDVIRSANWHADTTVDVQGERGRIRSDGGAWTAVGRIQNLTVSDHIIEFDAEALAGSAGSDRGFMCGFRASGSRDAGWPINRNNGYVLYISGGGTSPGHTAGLVRLINGQETNIAEESRTFTLNTNRRFRIHLDGDEIRVYEFTPGSSPTESDLLLSVTDSSHTSGDVELGHFGQTGEEVRFNNVLVDDLPEDEEHHSGAASATVLISAAGSGTAVEHTSAAAGATVLVSAVGTGTAVEHASGAASAQVTISAAGAGTAVEFADLAWIAPPADAELSGTVNLTTETTDERVVKVVYKIADTVVGEAFPDES